MESFINREPELRLITSALDDLLNKEHLLRTPIVDFYGISGIGKTSILRKAMQKCSEMQLPYVDINASLGLKDTLEQSIELSKNLLERGPLVMLLDAVDVANKSQLAQLEKMLAQLVLYNNLFVVLASRRSISFEQNSVARKLKTVPIEPLDRASSNLYLASIAYALKPEIRELIFEWTRGYPLAMNVLAHVITEQGIDPTDELEQKKLVELMVEQVINQGILANVKQDDLEQIKTTLNLLAVPRRFNLVTMQRIIERFAPALKLANSLAYIVLPKRIAQATDALSWNLAKAGFALDESVRHILLLQLKILHPERYYEMNRFLAEINWSNTVEVSGSDRIRYQLEYLYHSANSVGKEQMSQILKITVGQVIQDAENVPDQLIQFREEFVRDSELKEALGEHVAAVMEMVNRNLAQKMYEAAVQESDEAKRLQYLHNFFAYTTSEATVTVLPPELSEKMRRLLAQENSGVILKLYTDLVQYGRLSEALKKEFPILSAHLNNDALSKGEASGPC